jgi:hypothetical protein
MPSISVGEFSYQGKLRESDLYQVTVDVDDDSINYEIGIVNGQVITRDDGPTIPSNILLAIKEIVRSNPPTPPTSN